MVEVRRWQALESYSARELAEALDHVRRSLVPSDYAAPNRHPAFAGFMAGASASADLLVGLTESWGSWAEHGFIRDRLALSSYFWNAINALHHEYPALAPEQERLFDPDVAS